MTGTISIYDIICLNVRKYDFYTTNMCLNVIAVCMYRYVITLGLRSKYDVMVTISDLQRESLQIFEIMSCRMASI